jgi:hypothetical protein
VINEVYRVIVKKKLTPKRMGKAKRLKIGLQKPDFVVYLSSGSNLLGRLRRNQSFSLNG